MLEQPALPDESIIACLQDEFGLSVVQIAFRPLGADRNTAAYAVVADDKTPYFLKLRSGKFDQISLEVQKFLEERNIPQIIAPLASQTRRLWASLDNHKVILYPFIPGQNGYEVDMTDQQWGELGTALKRVHAADIPPTLIRGIQWETYSPKWRKSLSGTLEGIEAFESDDPLAMKLADFLIAKREVLHDLVQRANRLARVLQSESLESVLCHADLHAGNILIGADQALYIIDWDAPLLAPKERDLMYIGGGLMGGWRAPSEEETLFYQGYGRTQIDPIALAYYRYERIVEDIAIFCQEILMSQGSSEDREQSMRYLKSNFLPNNTIEIAYQSDKTR